jgi:hypothetical protein
MDPKLITPVLFAALIVWGIYRRMRRNIGRQRVQERRMWVRIGVLALATVLIAVVEARDLPLAGALLAGCACGALLGQFGLRYTQFEVTSEGRFYTPHAYFGIAITLLFAGRIAYRLLFIYHGVLPTAVAGANSATPYHAIAYSKSPLTLALFGLLVGYYAAYYLGVMRTTKSLAAPAQRISG